MSLLLSEIGFAKRGSEMNNGGMNVDEDGFLVGDTPAVKAPPVAVVVPAFFKGCMDLKEAATRSINELSKPYSVEQHGQDEMYARLSHALIVLLANYAGIDP